jgi:iron only hydrogenase large subunit-like protein
MNLLHTVTLDAEKCKGCVACMKRCPTEAIRVRDGKAKIHYDHCVNCGECVRICPYHAKKAVYDSFDVVKDPKFKYRIALPAPALYGQFENLDNLNYLIEGLLGIGFDDVFEVARGAELISERTRNYMKGEFKKPLISTACPAVLELVLIRFRQLESRLLPLLTPADVSAKLAREQAAQKTGLKPEEIGVFFISPCPAKVFALKMGLVTEKPVVDGVLSASEIYFLMINSMKKVKNPRDLSEIGVFGLSWATSGGEAASLLKTKYLAADGIENVLNVLSELENGKLTGLEFVELNACTAGCVGGVLNIENPFVAKSKIRAIRKYLPVSKNNLALAGKDDRFYDWKKPSSSDILKVDEDITEAIKKLNKVNKILNLLPMLDCGSCGAPSCKTFAEDVAEGEANINDCHRIDANKLFEL